MSIATSGRMKISEIMTADPEFCTPDDSVVDAARVMAEHDIGIVPICESIETRRLAGCITDRDIVVRVVAEGKDANVVSSLRQIMTHQLATCSPDDDIDDVIQLMEQRQVRRVLVTDEHGSLVGVVATADLASHLDRKKVGEVLEEISEPAQPWR
jgi:CBS domain-containing protein